jgi:hypothetical protein
MAVCSLLRPDDVPEAYRDLTTERDRNKAETGSCIIAPGGEVIAAAPANEETVLTTTVTLEAVFRCKARLDVGGHYSRPDVLKLLVNDRPLERIIETVQTESSKHDKVDVRSDGEFGAFSSVTDNEQETVREVPRGQSQSLKSR